MEMSFSSKDWSKTYEQTKMKIQTQRQVGKVLTQQESTSLSSALNRLESQLRMMQASPMEYELAASELSRREVMIANLKKQVSISFLLISSSSSSSSFFTNFIYYVVP
jgi:hypothetical protein